MKKEMNETTRSGWSFWLEKTSQSLKGAWRFANEFDLIEKTKENWPKVKAYGAAAMLFLSSFSLKANNAESVDSASDTIKKEIKAPSSHQKENAAETAEFDISETTDFKAYPGKYYNEICNGSPCWLSSTFETNGAGIGKNVSSIATWNDDGDYCGLNQISPGHAQKFSQWLGTQGEYKNVYVALKKGGVGKANWQAVAKKMEHPMTAAYEDYMVKKYNPENFKAIQDKLNKSGTNVNLKKLHPAILSLMHQIMVQRPAWRNKIFKKIGNFMETNGGDESKLNSKEFINYLTNNAKLQKRAANLLTDTTINWKQKQFADLLSQVKPANDDGRNWFDLQKESKNEQLAENTQPQRKSLSISAQDEKIMKLQLQTQIKTPETIELKKLTRDQITKAKKKTAKISSELKKLTRDQITKAKKKTAKISSAQTPEKKKENSNSQVTSQKDLYIEMLRNKKRSRGA